MFCKLVCFVIVISRISTKDSTYRRHTVSVNGNTFTNYRRIEFVNAQERIVGGIPADIRKYPFMAYMVRRHGQGDDFKGGASIIRRYWAITAAHCVYYTTDSEISQKIVLVRSNTAYWKEDYEDHAIKRKIIHEQYKTRQRDYDIALIEVEDAFDGSFEEPIALATTMYEYVPGSIVTILGWGSTHRVFNLVNKELMQANLTLVKDGVCRKLYKTHRNRNVTARMVCAHAQGTDACINDSGGPLYQNGVLIGIVSWGMSPCAHKILPGVYTKISNLRSWIGKKI